MIILGEACIYLVRDTGVRQADFVVNGVLESRWPNLVGGLIGGGGSGGGSTGPSASDFLSLPAPKNVLRALTNTCRSGEEVPSGHMGLLSQVGYKNLVNVTGLVHSDAVTGGIEKGKE